MNIPPLLLFLLIVFVNMILNPSSFIGLLFITDLSKL